MATHFNVRFVERYGTAEHIVECDHFRKVGEEGYLTEERLLTENTVLEIEFQAPPGTKLYFDGLDQMERAYVEEDGDGLYLRPRDTPYVLYNPNVRNNSPYPFIPGTYFLKVVTPENEEFEARTKVTTKRVTEDQHSLMIDEIEDAVRGLSRHALRKRSIYSVAAFDIFGPGRIDEYSVILSNKEKIISGLSFIRKTRRYSVVKRHPVIPRAKAKKIDAKSVKYLMMHPEQRSTIQAPVSHLTYDVPENRWVKGIAQLLLRYVNEMAACFLTPYNPNYDRVRARELRQELAVIEGHLTDFLHDRWMADVQATTSGQIPMALFQIGPFRVFLQIYQHLKKGGRPDVSRPRLQFHHKRSDLLYEIWGYMKVVGFLRDEGYDVVKNWFRTDGSTLDDTIVHDREASDYVELVKDDTVIRVFYDDQLPRRKKDLNPLKTLQTMTKNRPDCRLDVWKSGKFLGTLILDFKYRRKDYLWSETRLEKGTPLAVMTQLEAYAKSMQTDTKQLNGQFDPLINARPVTEVWAVYPVKGEHPGKTKKVEDYDIHLVELSPGSEHGYFGEKLMIAIGKILERETTRNGGTGE